MDESITITRADIERALREWDRAAKAENWTPRDDDSRFADEAEYVFGLLKA